MASGTIVKDNPFMSFGVLPNKTDFDTVMYGIWQMNTGYTYYNSPYTGGMLEVLGGGTNFRMQRLSKSTGDLVAVRYKRSSGWSDWTEFSGTTVQPINTPSE